MNNFMRVLLANVLSLLCAQGVLAKSINVRVRGIQRAATEVAKSIAARVQGSERYRVANSDAELLIDVNCMEGKEVSSAFGYICSFVFVYYPEQLDGMESVLSPIGLVTGPDASSVADDVFDAFVSATTNEKLTKSQKDLRISVMGYCHSSILDKNVRADCGQNAAK
jgi:hypothetical protein